jgi:hypothetical protein
LKSGCSLLKFKRKTFEGDNDVEEEMELYKREQGRTKLTLYGYDMQEPNVREERRRSLFGRTVEK